MGAKTFNTGAIRMFIPADENVPIDVSKVETITLSEDEIPKKLDYQGNLTFTCEGYWESQIQDFIDKLHEEEAYERMKNGANSTIAAFGENIWALFKYGKDMSKIGRISVIPEIDDVRIINDKVIIMSFVDGTEEKAVLCKEDTFSLEQGISICITKKILSTLTNGNGSSIYNKLIQKGLDVYKSNRQAEKDYEKYLEEEKALAKRKAEKEKRKRIKKANREKEKQIGIQKEAIIRALKELNIASADDSENVGV